MTTKCSVSSCDNDYNSDYYIPDYGYICQECNEQLDWSDKKLCCDWANRHIIKITFRDLTQAYEIRVFCNAMDFSSTDFIKYCPMCGTNLEKFNNGNT